MPLCLIKERRSPPGTNCMARYKCRSSWNEYSNLTSHSDSDPVITIRSVLICSTLLFANKTFLSTFFTAQISLVSIFRHKNTCPYAPSPTLMMTWKSPIPSLKRRCLSRARSLAK
eukprot:Lithocolla_globosa_v1_NODE_3045_length_1781_cov_3.306312.p4 type:complete len:115 gc:universal NODE_3045_length_1781_cov_3.306312:856-512(-)